MLKRLVLAGKDDKEFLHLVVSLTDLGVIGQELSSAGIQVYALGMQSFWGIPKLFWKLKKTIKIINPDVVQTWMYHADFLGGLAANSIGVKKILWGIRTTHVTKGSSIITKILRILCAKLSYTIPTSIICAAYISKDVHIEIGYDPSKMIVIPNGYALNKLNVTQAESIRLRKELDFEDNDIVIGSVGRFNPDKNQKLFIKVAKKLNKLYPNMKFMMVGRDNTENNKELMALLDESKLTANFRLLGQRSDVACCFKVMDIFCLHSKTEGFPNVLAEAMALGVPSVSVDVGDAKYIIGDISGIVPAENCDELVKAIINLVEEVLKDKEKLRTLRIAYKEHISEKYSIEKIYEQYRYMWSNKI
nr:glycosyltransferase [Acinetobacter indicus]